MAGNPSTNEGFETWFLRQVAQAVEAGEVPATLLTHLQAEIETARERPAAESHDAAVRHVAEIAEVDEAHAREVLEAIEAQPTVTRELLMRRIAKAWLEGQRRARGLRWKPESP